MVPEIAGPDKFGQKIAVPAYIHPGAHPECWNSLIDAPTSKVGVAIANVLNGPTYQKDQTWADVIHRAHATGKRVLGYVDTGCLGLTGLATRLGSAEPADWFAQIEQDVNFWYRLYGDDLDGVFFDQGFDRCGTANMIANWYSFLSQYVKRNHSGSMTVLNLGSAVPQCYENTADVLVTFEGDGSSYLGLNPTVELNFEDPGWVPSDPDKFWHIIYDVSADQLARVISTSRTRHAGYVYVTDDVLENPYDTIPNSGYWKSEQDYVAGGPITPAPAAPFPDGEPLPGAPSNLTVLGSDETSASLRWTAAANAMAHLIYLDGRRVASLPATLPTTVTIGGLVPGGRRYVFHVTAQGRSGQISAATHSVELLTASPPDGQATADPVTGPLQPTRSHHPVQTGSSPSSPGATS